MQEGADAYVYYTENLGKQLGERYRFLRVFMATLRKKLEKNGEQTQYIQTHIGVGYRMLKVE